MPAQKGATGPLLLRVSAGVRGDEGGCDQDRAFRHRAGFPLATFWTPVAVVADEQAACARRDVPDDRRKRWPQISGDAIS
jgi:hypothetical protein